MTNKQSRISFPMIYKGIKSFRSKKGRDCGIILGNCINVDGSEDVEQIRVCCFDKNLVDYCANSLVSGDTLLLEVNVSDMFLKGLNKYEENE